MLCVLAQAVAYVCKTKVASKRNGTYKPHDGGGAGGGRPPALSAAQKKRVVKELKKTRFCRVRAPDLKRRLHLKCSTRTVNRTVNEAGYWLPKLVNRRVLDSANKRARVAYATEHRGHDVGYWKRRGYGDAHFWHLARTKSELEAGRGAKQKPVYRTKKEGKDPRFHGGKKGVYKQGKRVGLFGMMVHGKLHTAWIPMAKFNGTTFAGIVRRHFSTWAEGRAAVVLDGEKCMHGGLATAALTEAGVPTETLPPNSPDLNPIENAWALLDGRLSDTDPGKLEKEPAYKARVENAVRWCNRAKKALLENMVESMPRRLAAAVQLKGARTSY